jgi:hypothetical protein
MIAHVVLFEPLPGMTDAERQNLVEGLGMAARAIPGIRRLRVGRRLTHGVAGYEQAMRDDYSFAAIIEFDTVTDLRGYLEHPAHEQIARHFSQSSVRALAYDYDLVEAVDADSLLNAPRR